MSAAPQFIFSCKHSGVVEIREVKKGHYVCETCGALVVLRPASEKEK